jgi:hypothetical protein
VDALRDTLVDGRRDSVHEALVDGFVDSSRTEESLSGKPTPEPRRRGGWSGWQASMLFPKGYLNHTIINDIAERSSRAAVHSTGEERAVGSQQQSKTMAGQPEFAVFASRARATPTREAEKRIESPLNPFSSMSQVLRSQSGVCEFVRPARQHSFQNHVILQAQYAGFAYRRINELAPVRCVRF